MDSLKTKEERAGGKEIILGEGLFHMPSSPDERPYLKGSKCLSCGLVFFPKLKICPKCLRRGTIEEATLTGKGVIDTFAVVNSALPGFKSPSVQAYINLLEGPRVWGLITGCEPDELEIGMEMELAIGEVKRDGEGNVFISYQFRPIGRSLK